MSTNSNLEGLLIGLFEEVIGNLRKKIKKGEASAQDIKNAIQLLKDNGITCEVKRGSPVADLLGDLDDFIGSMPS